MRTRRFIISAFFAISTLFFVSCFGQSRLEKLVKSINDECPYSAGESGEMTSAEIKDGNAVVTFTVNEELMNIEVLQANPDLLRNSLVQIFNNPTDDLKELIDELKRCNAGLTYVYVGEVSGKSISVTMTSDELKEMSKSNKDKNPDEFLDAQISITNAQTPVRIDEMTVMTRLEREDDCAMFYYDVDESQFSFDEVEDAKDMVVEMLIENLRMQKNQPENTAFIHACKLADVDIAYKYRGTTTDREIIFIVPIDSI